MQPPVRIGARASQLSQTQTRWVRAAVVRALGAPDADADAVAPLVLVTTTGDRIQDRRLLEVGGKQLFTKEIEEALLDGRIDLAVHSMKDMPAVQPEGLVLAAVPEREDPRDALIARDAATLGELPRGARVGTASLRRQAQLLARRPDLEIGLLRGNVDTRLRRLQDGDFDAIVLAAAGLARLGLKDRISAYLDPLADPPAPGQGALAVQCRVADVDAPWLEALRHRPTTLAVAAERGAMEALEGSCRTAIGAFARLEGERISLSVEALAPDGAERWREDVQADLDPVDAEGSARRLGLAAGQTVRRRAGDRLELG